MRRSAVVCVIAVALMLGLTISPARSQAAVSSPCPGDQGDPTTSGWALSTTTFDNAYTRHAYVGNGYLSQRVPATGTGYVATTQETGWPLFTNAYDGAFVAGLYSTEPDPLIPPHDATIAAIPTWSTLKVGTGPDTYSATTPAGQISNFRQTLFLRCGVLRTSLTWTPARRPRHGPRLRRARRARSTARGRGEADGDAALERAGHGHRRDRRRGRPQGHPDRRRSGRGRAHRRRRVPHHDRDRTGRSRPR